MERVPFTWEGVDHWTGADLVETLMLLGDQDEADSFLSAYAEVCEDDDHALHNIRYLVQVISTDSDSDTAEEDGRTICDFFGLKFPAPTETIAPHNWFFMSSLGVKAKLKEKMAA